MNVRVSCSRAAHPSYEVHAGKPRCDTVILLSNFSRCLVHVCLSKRINPNIVVIRDQKAANGRVAIGPNVGSVPFRAGSAG
jgi:hypothetical protein